jgi:hypothetical protein
MAMTIQSRLKAVDRRQGSYSRQMNWQQILLERGLTWSVRRAQWAASWLAPFLGTLAGQADNDRFGVRGVIARIRIIARSRECAASIPRCRSQALRCL